MARFLAPARKAKACANCSHFAPNGSAFVHRPVGGIYATVGEQARGDCRAKPPTLDRKTGAALWPDVLGHDWCSTFTPVEAKAKARVA